VSKVQTSITIESDDLPINTGALIARICKAASERWPEDPCRPGVQVAHLPGVVHDRSKTTFAQKMGADVINLKDGDEIVGAQWYVALHRYRDSHGQDRIVQFKAGNADLDLALLDIAKQLTAACVVVERNELENLLVAALKAVS
jgi:hypothetical protein